MLFTGNYSESLRDAKVARQLQPTYLEAIVRGNVHILLQNGAKTTKTSPLISYSDLLTHWKKKSVLTTVLIGLKLAPSGT